VKFKSFTEQYVDSLGVFGDAIIGLLAAMAQQERIRISAHESWYSACEGSGQDLETRDQSLGRIKNDIVATCSRGQVSRLIPRDA